MDGILCVYKEAGYTSHDVINRLRRISHQKKIGHTGTLDPNAEGVLPVCFGNATKVCGLLTDTDKVYRAELILGKVTDTYDITGEVKKECDAHVTKDELIAVVQSFIGTQLQLPPMFSARKINGQKLYDLARQGIEVERTPKEITIYDIAIDEVRLRKKRNVKALQTEVTQTEATKAAASFEDSEEIESAVLTVHCSKGTYIRSICHDIGEKLGCGACMGSLLRTRVGRFNLEDCKKIKELQKLNEQFGLKSLLIPADAMFPEYPVICELSKEAEALLKNGNPISLSLLSKETLSTLQKTEQDARKIRMYNEAGRFCAIYEYRKEKPYLKPITMFPEYLVDER